MCGCDQRVKAPVCVCRGCERQRTQRKQHESKDKGQSRQGWFGPWLLGSFRDKGERLRQKTGEEWQRGSGGCRGGTGGRVPEIREEAGDEYAEAVARVACQYHSRHKYLLSLSPRVTITAFRVYHYHRFSCHYHRFSCLFLFSVTARHYHRRHKYLCVCTHVRASACICWTLMCVSL